ncbi:MAG: thioesterase family protein [bacterium]|nr:thioesterase family protein [bacterium]
MTFADASALERIGDNGWAGEIQPGWDILGNANGGYVLAMAARAGVLASGRPDPVTITGHFLAPAGAGPITIDTEVLKEGRRFATVAATVRNGKGRALVAALGSYGELTAFEGPERVEAEPPDLPSVDQCIKVVATDTLPPPFMANVDLRVHPEDVPAAVGSSGYPRVRGWFRWAHEEALDTIGLVVAADAFPPTIFNANLPVAWTPTLELTTHIRERPESGEWLRCSFHTRFITGGFLEEDGELWDEDGRLIAQSRQLALLPRA